MELEFKVTEEKEKFVPAIIKPKNLQPSTEQAKLLNVAGPYSFGLGATALFAFIIYKNAEIVEHGGTIGPNGRRCFF